jgi:MSHA biogenesis protein MshO
MSRLAAPAPWRRAVGGFTLVELVMALVVMGVLAATLVVFLRPTLDAFMAARERGPLVAEVDQAARRMVRDVQGAVPNSIRAPSASCFELVPTVTGGRYRMAPDTVVAGSAAVDPSTSTTSFDVLTPMATLPQVGDWVVVDNQNPGDVYSGSNRSAITGVSTPAASHGQHRLAINALQFPAGYDGGRFAVVPDTQQAVFYVCSGASTTLDSNGNAPGTLVRLKRYGFNAAVPGACPSTAGGDLLARHVRSCRFLYDPNQGATQQSGFLSIQLELTRNNETASLVVGAHVVNAP